MPLKTRNIGRRTRSIGKAHSCLAGCLLGIVTPLCLFSELGQFGGKDQEGIWKGQVVFTLSHPFHTSPYSCSKFLHSCFPLHPPGRNQETSGLIYTLRCESFAGLKRHLYFSDNLMVQQEIGQHLTKSPAPLMRVFL